jgi:hypothetical protein
MIKRGFIGALLMVALLMVAGTAQAGRWDAVVTVSTAQAGQQINANALQGDTLILVDGTLGFAGLRLHACTDPGFKFVGLSKTDPTSNPVQIFMDAGVSVGGYSHLALVERDDVIVLGCGAGRWFLESRSEAVNREDAVNRTVIASNINPRIINAEIDRGGIERVVANTSVPAVVQLPTMDHCSGVPGYACTYDIKIYRVGTGSISQVHVYPPPGRAFENDAGPVKLCLPDQTLDLHYDGAQWRVQNKYPDDVARGTPCN